VIRLIGAAARAGLALSLVPLLLAMLRFEPVYASPPWNVRALPWTPVVLGFAVLAALTGRERSRPLRVRPLVLGAVAVALALALVVAVRGSGGIPGQVLRDGSVLADLRPGPIDVIGQDLPGGRGDHFTLRWEGPLRAPRSGVYTLRVEGRGSVTVWLAGRIVLEAEGQRLDASARLNVGRGEHTLVVEQRRESHAELRLYRIRGQRLRLSWVAPDDDGSPGTRDEVIPPRFLGAARPALLWAATDVLALCLAMLLAALAWIVPWNAPRRLAPPTPWRARELAASAALYLAAIVVMSWPLAAALARRGVVDDTDGRLNVWILSWVAHALTHAPGTLFDAPIFHATPNALALSENLLIPALIGAPASLLGQPVLAYNLALLVSLVVSGLGTELLVRRVTADRTAARVAGLLFAVGIHRWSRLGHLHAHVTLFLPFALLALDRFWERRTLRRALAVGTCVALQAMSSIYLGAIAAVTVTSAVAVGLLGRLTRADLLKLAAGGALAGALVAPLARPYLESSRFHGTEWTLDDVAPHATTLESYVASGSWLYGSWTGRHLDPERHRAPRFPGIVTLLLGIAGLAVAPRRYRAVALVASAVAVSLSLGPESGLFRFLHEHVFLFRGIRGLARFSIVPIFALAVLAGLAVAGRRRLALIAVPLFLLESCNAPLRFGEYDGPSEVARWLAGRPGAVAVLPLGSHDTEAMLDATAHYRPLVNGYSGLTPRHYEWAHELLDGPRGPVTEEALRFLRALDVRDVVHARELPLPRAARFESVSVYEVPPGSAARVPLPGKPCAALWSADGSVVLDLGEPRLVDRVVFRIGRWPWVEEPVVELSEDGGAWRPVRARASLADAVLALVRDPVNARGELTFERQPARLIRLSALPIRQGPISAGP
jgi:hypothetical protein